MSVSYDVNNTNGALYNSRLLKFCDTYVREKYSQVDLKSVYEAAGIYKYEIDDPGHWFTQDQCDGYYSSLIEMCGNPGFPREAGRYIIRSKEMWVVRQFILGMLSPAVFFDTIEKNYSKLSRGVYVSARLLGEGSAEMVCRNAPGTNTLPYQCQVFVGILEAIGLLFTQAFAHVEHSECVHEGGEVCRFKVSWRVEPSMVWRRIRNCLFWAGTPVALGLVMIVQVSLSLLVSFGLVTLLLLLSCICHKKREEELLKIIKNQGHYADKFADDDNIRNRHALLIKSISQEAAFTDSQDGVAQGVISVMERHLDYDRLVLFFCESIQLRFAHQMGYTSDQEAYFKDAGDRIFEVNAIQRVLKNKENLFINGVKGYSETALFGPDFPDEQTLDTLLAVPVIMEGQISGVLIAANLPGKRVLTQGDLSLLIGVASQMGLSIDNVIKRRELAEGELRYRTQVQNGLEDERRRIAFDLHDHVAQDLGSLLISARMMQEKAGQREEGFVHDLQSFVTVLRTAINSVRNIAYDLQPPSLAQFGLVHTLQAYATDFSAKNDVVVDFRSAGVQEGLLKYDTMINYFRIVQESLANTVKHARASKISIRLVLSHPTLILRIRDNGIGFYPRDVQTTPIGSRHMGLRNMEERTRLMNGSFRIDSSPGKGCEVVVEVPLDCSGEGEGPCDVPVSLAHP